ncbi:RNA binding methyltransferase FtsJ like [Halalkalibacter hemicellulosilyticusJCM 9152]|uniref:RNA binding methyltransferase FtsJ like n=1 Tax=Halalkalibacter hemicellulosilyticusJCM 9152 TaxID=1236971 RepID=W4QID2_9BACI|nr:RNA binding methyltransferase FtsJ like [Halalkalibacter hemicellulosilyticusJCM 9152]
MAKKERIDVLLVERGLFETREKAKRAIMAGLVFSGTERIDKPGVKIDSSITLEVKGNPIPYVSRGGLKLEKALRVFLISLQGKLVIDIGASTGALLIAPCKMGQKPFMQLMSAITNYHGS